MDPIQPGGIDLTKAKPVILVVLALVLWTSSARAGAWTKEPGHFYLQLGTAFTTADSWFSNTGDIARITVKKFSPRGNRLSSNSNYQQLLTDVYFEVGVLDRLTVFGDVPYVSARQENPGGDVQYSSNSLGDTLVGARLGLLTAPIAVAVETRLGLPTGDSRSIIPTGSGDLRGEMRLAFGKAWSSLPLYFDLEFGLMFRGAARVRDQFAADGSGVSLANYAPELAIHGELGGALLRLANQNKVSLIVFFDYRGSTQKSTDTSAAFSVLPENSELTTVGAALAIHLYSWCSALLRYTQAVEGLRLPQLSVFGAALVAQY